MENSLIIGEGFEIKASTFQEAQEFCDFISRSSMVPEAYRTKPGTPDSKAADVYLAIVRGAELGLKPTQALNCINVIKGRPSLSTDAKKALCMRHGKISQTYDDSDGIPKWTVKVEREGYATVEITYSAQDALCAGLMKLQKTKDGQAYWAGKEGSAWAGYWKRMLLKRATAWALDEAFPDILNGFSTQEDLEDIVDVTPPPTASVSIAPAPVSAPASAPGSQFMQGQVIDIEDTKAEVIEVTPSTVELEESSLNIEPMQIRATNDPQPLDTTERILNKLSK